MNECVGKHYQLMSWNWGYWLYIGDFNQVLNLKDKLSQKMSNVQGMEKFAECIEQAGLVDSPSKAG